VLTSALRISKAEAARRVRAAEAVGPSTSMLGEPLAAVRPYLAAAQRDGELSTEQVAIIERAITPVDRRALTPLFWEHVRPYGEVRLDLGSRLSIGVDAGR
jgi:DNA-binding transcriptional regulator YdaS (Cro superfamily)